jgi:hypothetical protein
MGWSDDEAIEEYVRTHWGDRGFEEVITGEAPDPRSGTMAMLGRLVSVTYETIKAGDRKPTLYEHDFEPFFPILAFNRQGLIVVRDLSPYTVNSRGIVG